MADPILPTTCDFHGKCRDFLHAANLRHRTDGFTSPPKEGMLRIFFVRKIRGLLMDHNCHPVRNRKLYFMSIISALVNV